MRALFPPLVLLSALLVVLSALRVPSLRCSGLLDAGGVRGSFTLRKRMEEVDMPRS